jgi:acetyltransferase-like isoleucine patch superfamily enzyme
LRKRQGGDPISSIVRTLHNVRKKVNLWIKFRRNNRYIKYLRKLGVRIGNDVVFQHPGKTAIDLSRPYLITIGNNVIITTGVHILTHDFTWMVLREIYKRPFGSAGKVEIGDNVFIGMNAIILKGVKIGNNVVIGAGSVVYKEVPDNSIVAGNPARVITTMEKVYKRHLEREMKEASLVVMSIRERYGREPRPTDFNEFFHLFLPRDLKSFKGIPVKHQVGRYMGEFMKSRPEYPSFEAFIKACDRVEKEVNLPRDNL